MHKILPQIQTNAKKTDELIVEYVERNLDLINNDLFSGIKYAIEIISVYRERSFIIKTVGDYLKLSDESLIPFMISSEMIILSSYIKDDVIDSTERRSGKETVHIKYGNEYAILISDIVLFLANKLLLETIEKNKLSYNIIYRINNSYIDLCVGQSMRIEDFSNASPIEIERIAYLKAGSIIGTFSSIPALIITDNNLANTFYEYGKWLGISLQFKNDFEDFSIEEINLDCKSFQDIRFKQPNILISYLFKSYSNLTYSEKKLIQNYWGCQHIKDMPINDKMQIIEMFDKYNIINEAYNHLSKTCENSIYSIKEIDKSLEKSSLLELVKMIYHLD